MSMNLAGLAVFVLPLIAFHAVAEDHLTPLDARGTSLHIGYDVFVEKIYPAQADELVGFYVWPGNMPSGYLGVLEANAPFRYFILSAENTQPEPTVTILKISPEHAAAISNKLAEIIRLNTRYGERNDERFDCLDAVERVFTSQKYYGKTDCYGAGSIPDRLTKIHYELVKMSSDNTTPESAAPALDKVVEMLDDLLASIENSR
jgi:hypothetical protein